MWRAALLATVLVVVPKAAHAYPQFVAKSYTNCGTCHYSPTGGGLVNAYGHATLEAMFPNVIEVEALERLREWLPKGNVTGYADDGTRALQLDVGLDARLLFLQAPTQQNGRNALLVIPMLAEAGGVLAYGPLLAYGTVTPRRAGPKRTSMTAFSREHWLQVGLSDTMSMRVGRLVLPFGLRIPDHTQYTREDLGFGKWAQSYAVELDTFGEDWMWSSAVFAGDFSHAPLRSQERGGVVSVARNVPGRGSIGVSALLGGDKLVDEAAASLFARFRLWQRTYVMSEAAGYRHWSPVNAPGQLGFAAFLRAGWFVQESLDLFIELGGRAVSRAFKLTKLRYMLGANWQLLPWIELAPSVLLEEDPEAGLSESFLGQLHVIY